MLRVQQLLVNLVRVVHGEADAKIRPALVECRLISSVVPSTSFKSIWGNSVWNSGRMSGSMTAPLEVLMPMVSSALAEIPQVLPGGLQLFFLVQQVLARR